MGDNLEYLYNEDLSFSHYFLLVCYIGVCDDPDLIDEWGDADGNGYADTSCCEKLDRMIPGNGGLKEFIINAANICNTDGEFGLTWVEVAACEELYGHLVPDHFALPTHDEFINGDTNKDGIMTLSEYERLVPDHFALPTDNEFINGDTNQDGILTWTEYKQNLA